MCGRRARAEEFILNQSPIEQPEFTASPLYFRSRSSYFSAYLIAANLLRYTRTELAPDGKDVDFVFHDPAGRGPDLWRRYNAGAGEPVNARTLYEVRGYLLFEVRRVQGGANGQRK